MMGDGSHKLRGMIVADGEDRFSVIDAITKACNKNDNGAYARVTYANLIKPASQYRDEILKNVTLLKFPGQGQRETPTMSIRGLQRLLMILGGKVSEEYRKLAEGTFTRVMAGDTTLIEVIEANAASNGPVQRAFKQALAQEPVEPVLDDVCKKRPAGGEDFELLEWEERKERLLELRESRKQKALANSQSLISILCTLNPGTGVDERTRLQIEDLSKNILLPPGKRLTANGLLNGEADPNQPIAVQVAVGEMGLTATDPQVQAIGRAMAKRYRATYGKEPNKHKQYVRGNYVLVNSYTEKDRAMLEDAIREVLQP